MLESEVWVAHPENGAKLVNVGPLLYQLSKFGAPAGSLLKTGSLAVLNKTIRLLNVIVHDSNLITPVDLANLYQDLYTLSDALDGLNEREA